MTRDQAKQQIADAIACKTAMAIAQGWEPLPRGDGEIWMRSEERDALVATFQRPSGDNMELRNAEILLSEVPDLADKWNHRGNRAARRKRASIARKR